MRNLKLQMQLSIDGFVAGPNGEMDWMNMDWDEELKNCVENITQPVDTILLGRNLAQGFIPYWASVAANVNDPQNNAGRKFSDTHKVVFTKSLGNSTWENTSLAPGDLVTEVNNLKQSPGGDIIVYGGGKFVSSLIEQNLIDEYYLFINPVAIGKGMSIFGQVEAKLHLTPIEAIGFKCGIMLLHYRNK